MIIAIEMVGGALSCRKTFERSAVDQKNIGPAIVVVVKYRNTGTGGFDDVFLAAHAAEHVHHRKSRLLGDIRKVSDSGRGRRGLSVCDAAC